MENKYDILIFSIFGRNTWLAAQLRALGLRVAFFDLTSLFQKGSPDDWEGPFPLIFSDSMERSYSQSFTEQDEFDVLMRGPSLKLKGQGVLEFKSDHAKYVTHRWGQEGLWFFEGENLGYGPEISKKATYNNLWLKAFLKQWRSSVLRPLNQLLQKSDIPEFALNSHYVVRHTTRDGFLNANAWLKSVGVDVLPVSSWWRCGYEADRKAWVLKLDSDTEALQAEQLILGLTSYELHRFSGQLDLEEKTVRMPKGFWSRWRGTCADTDKLAYVPTYTMYLNDIEMGLCNENLITVIKRPNNELDVWACVTTEVLSRQEFLDELQAQVLDKVKKAVPEFHDLKLQNLKLGSDLYSFWPVYDQRQTSAHHKHVIMDQPEVWPALDNYSRYKFSLDIIKGFKDEVELEQGASL